MSQKPKGAIKRMATNFVRDNNMPAAGYFILDYIDKMESNQGTMGGQGGDF